MRNYERSVPRAPQPGVSKALDILRHRPRAPLADAALTDASAEVRRHAVRMLASLGEWEKVARIAASDPDPSVRCEALGSLSAQQRIEPLARVGLADPDEQAPARCIRVALAVWPL